MILIFLSPLTHRGQDLKGMNLVNEPTTCLGSDVLPQEGRPTFFIAC